MAWQRDEANLGISGATAYSYTEVDWEVQGDRCTYRHIGGVTSPYNFSATATSTLQWWEGGTWHDYAGPASATFNGYGDLPLVDVEDSFVRQAADRVVSLGCYTTMMGGSARAWIDYTVPHLPSAPTNLTATHVSDNKVSLSWTAPSRIYEAMCIERSVDGGAYSEVAVLRNTATSWDDTTTTADHAYKYRLRAYYYMAYSAYTSESSTITMTPAAPQSISTAAAGGTNIDVTVVNPSPVATKVQYEVSTDGGSTWGATQDSASLTSFSVSASGTVKIRVRNYNATGTSAWLESGTVTTICPPAKPTVTSPSSNVWDISKPLVVSWLHNSLDGSAQTAAKITLVKSGTPPVSHVETLDPFTGNTYSIDFATAQSWISGLAVGDVLNVAVKTKGADASYSSNTVVNGIKAYTAPTLNITSPSASVTSMPVSISATYSDMAGFTCQAAAVTLKSGDRTILTKPATISGTSLSCDISPSDAILDNGATYTIVLDVRSSSGLQASANATFTTSFAEPTAGDLSVVNDPETGYASLLATFDNSASEVEYSGDTNAQYESTEGYVRSLTVEGKSAKWNQLTSAAVTSGSSDTVYGITRTKNADGSTSYSGTASGVPYQQFPLRNAGVAPICSLKRDGTKYFCFVNKDLGHPIGLNGFGVNFGRTEFLWSNTAGGTWTAAISVDMPDGTVFNVSNVYQFIIDLTAIYGAGNEPTTLTDPRIEWLKAYALAHPDYDAGSLVSIGSVGVWSQELPEKYEPCGYVESTRYGNAIKTGVIPTANFGMDITFLTNDEISSNSYGCICGGRVASGNKDFQLTTFSGTPSTYQGSLRGGSNTANPAITIGIKQRVLWKNGSLTRADGVTLAYSPNQAGEYEIYLFALNNGGTIAQCNIKPARIYRATFFDGNTTVADFVPCTHNGEVGFYDLVGGTFKSNANTFGTLTAGYDDWAPTTTITTPLRSAGSIADELQVDETEAQVARKVGVVDLGTLTWTYGAVSSGTPYGYFRAFLSVGSAGYACPSLCAKYRAGWLTTDKTFIMGSSNDVYIIDSSYTDAAAFKAAMSGVYLFYELATPTQDPETSMSTIELGTAFTVATDLDSTFEMTTWDGSADAVSISVSRVNADGSLMPLVEDGASGAGAVDKYAPLNTPYQYAVTTKSSANAVKTVYVDNEIVTDLWFAYWGDNVASAKWNPDNGGIQLSRPQKTRVYYAGRKDPVSYDGSAVALSETPSWMLVDRSEAQPFVQLVEDGGRGVYKSCDGWVYHADFDLTLSPKYIAIGYYGGIGLTVTRIAGDAL